MALRVCQLCAVDFTLNHFLLPLVDGMKTEGWDVTCVCSDGDFVPELRNKGYKIITVPIQRSLNVFSHVVSAFLLYKVFKRNKFDVLHAHTPIAALIGRIAAKAARVPLVIYTAHGFYFHDEMPRWKRRVYVAIEKLGARFGDFVFTQSAEDAEAAVKERICKSDEVMTIGNGVNVDRFAPRQMDKVKSVRNTLGITDSGTVVGIVGRLVNEKGYPEFLEAAVQVSQRFPDTYFLLVGSRLKSDHNQSIDDLLISSKNKLGDRLIMTGFREDVPELMGAMDVFCLPSHREGMPRTIIEAMLMGKPIVATDIRGSREEVLPEKTGLLVPTRSPEKLAEAICRLLSDPEMMKRMGAHGRERALQLYDERKVVSKQLSKIKDLLNLKRPKNS